MARLVLIAVLAVTVIHRYGAMQIQMPEKSELEQPEDELQTQVRDLQKNVSEIWTYMYDLRTAVSNHLTHLRQHQVELETSVHKMEHIHDGIGDSHTHGDSRHHSGEQHSHGGDHGSDHHSHGDDHSSDHHSHGGDHGSDSHSHGDDHGSDSHSHGGDHSSDHDSHGDDHSSDHHSHGGDHSHSDSSDHHSHSGEHHSHSGDDHSHSSEKHSHSGEQFHNSHSHSHSHSSRDHSKEDNTHSDDGHDSHHHHEQNHKDSHETEDLHQQTQKVDSAISPVLEPVVVASTTKRPNSDHHHHHHSHSHSQAGRSDSRSNTMDLMHDNSFHHHGDSHQHHRDSASRSRNKTVELPKYSDYDMYDFATCAVQPNRAIPEEQQQNVGGRVTLWQKKSGGPLNLHVQLQGFQMGDHHGHHGAHQAVQQEENSVQEEENTEPPQEVSHRHGFHVHTNGDLSDGCQSTGPHYNPKGVNHGGPTALVRHVGDLGSIECDQHGVTNILFSDDVASLRGQYSIYGKSLVIHANQDDIGLGGDAESLKTGNAGTRIACCVIQKVEKLPIRYYKAMKTATQYKNR